MLRTPAAGSVPGVAIPLAPAQPPAKSTPPVPVRIEAKPPAAPATPVPPVPTSPTPTPQKKLEPIVEVRPPAPAAPGSRAATSAWALSGTALVVGVVWNRRDGLGSVQLKAVVSFRMYPGVDRVRVRSLPIIRRERRTQFVCAALLWVINERSSGQKTLLSYYGDPVKVARQRLL